MVTRTPRAVLRFGAAGLAIALSASLPAPAVGTGGPAPGASREAAAVAAWAPVHGSAQSADDAVLAPASGGRLFVAIQEASGTVVAGFDARGRLLAGWPRTLSGWSGCWIGAVSRDGSVRLVCRSSTDSVRAFAFSATGQRLAGWPVNVSGAAGSGFSDFNHVTLAGDEPRIVGDRLVILLQRWDGTPALRLVRISPAGSLAVGTPYRLPAHSDSANLIRALGADGTGFSIRIHYSATGADSTRITAFGMRGVKAGWPVTLNGGVSAPTVGPAGHAYVVQSSYPRGSSRIRVLEPNGTLVAGWRTWVPLVPDSAWSGAGDTGPASPVVGPAGGAWIVSGAHGTDAWAFSPTGGRRGGWPYRSQAHTSLQGQCEPIDTGCGYLRVSPVAGGHGTIYIAQDPVSTSRGGRIVALGTNGAMRSGWPKTLVNPDGYFRSIAVASNGTVYGLAFEREGTVTSDDGVRSEWSATVVAIGEDGVVHYRRTLIDP